MKEQLLNALENTGRTIRFIDQMNRMDVGNHNADRFMPILMAVTPAVFALFAASEVGKWVIGELGRQMRVRERRPESPSLRGTPTPAEIEEDWMARPRTMEARLRLGSRLADLDATLDHTLVRKEDACGRMVIRARKGGMKGWLADNRVKVGYGTVMKYKKLAQRLRQLLELDDRIPLEWAMGGVPEGQELPGALARECARAGRRLAKLRKENPTLGGLSRAVEKGLGIVRLVAVGRGRKRGERRDISVISREGRVEATRGAMARVLGAGNLSGRALHLQNRVKVWLRGVGGEAVAAGGRNGG